MIVLDTNVISEAWRPAPALRVIDWLDDQDSMTLVAPVVAELLVGAERLPQGRRRSRLEAQIRALLARFDDRVVPFDLPAARHFARLVEHARRAGQPVSQSDAQIAACAMSVGAVVATRDTAPFTAMGLTVIDPWEDA